ncbi:MAG: transketolase-like TK C-terminal-containing protein, partial [Enterococcus sp.]
EGRNIWFGVREFAMAAAMNGIQLHGGTRVYGGTFFVFTDYLRPAIRLASIQNVPVTYVLTHDSVAVGEDGPTHEPIEQLASVRCMPGVHVIRPADGNETRAAWKIAMESTDTPTILVLSRQNLPVLAGTKENADTNVQKGGYVLSPAQGDMPEGILIATGSEVALAVEAQKVLLEQGKDVSVVSLPSFDLFESQTEEYKEAVLPKAVTKRIGIEAASSFGWDRYVESKGKTITINHFGASAPGDTVMSNFGFTSEKVVEAYNSL